MAEPNGFPVLGSPLHQPGMRNVVYLHQCMSVMMREEEVLMCVVCEEKLC